MDAKRSHLYASAAVLAHLMPAQHMTVRQVLAALAQRALAHRGDPDRSELAPYEPQELARLLNCPKPGITRAMQGLVSLQLIERRRHPSDKRRAHVWLTQKGADFVGRLFGQPVHAEGRAR